ncbi:MAG: hypothetical protein L6R37_005276 [Teloschistes peruensis]|nr:MAG: hypothetical protein L6R37_005276 [Teloschistes peruensis]
MATHLSASLDQTFKYPSSDPQCHIKWTRLGSPDAQAVILIHGTPWSSRLWVPYALGLSSKYSVYIFDNPGYGQSKHLTQAAIDAFTNNGSLSQQAEATAALLTHWGFTSKTADSAQSVRAPHVIAHDNAGLVSLRMALQHGCIYKSLALIDVVAVGPWGLPFFKLVAENPDVFKAIPPQMFDGITRGYIRNAAHKPLRKEDEDMLAEPWVSGEGRPGQEGLVRVLQQASARKSDDVEGQYRELGESGLPIRIIWGKNDKWLPCETAEKLKELIGGKCEVVLIEEAGHLIQLDQPERLMAEIVLFLGEDDRVTQDD